MKKNKFIIVMIIVLSMLIIASCSESQPVEEASTPTQQDNSSTTQNDTSSIKGQIVTTNKVENTEGGYYIPIPDSWFNKVSYELDGTNTYIYHITKYQDELELNPVLLHVDASSDIDADSPGVNVFLDLDGIKYYEILRFDAPYNQGSNDDIEFNSFYEDVPQILQSVWTMDRIRKN